MSTQNPIRIISADAPKAGLRKAAETFSTETGIPHELELATPIAIRERLTSGASKPDLIVLPLAALEDMAKTAEVEGDSIAPIGAITVGVAVRNGAREPDLGSVEGFTRSVLDAERLIYNTASSGQYVAKMLEGLGLMEKIRERTVIVPTGVAVMQELAADTTGAAIGFGHVTEIRLHDKLGTHLVGPLPGKIGRVTVYAIALLTNASSPSVARKLIDYLKSSAGKDILVNAGVV